MLKIRIIAALVSLLLTAATVYLFPILYFAYVHWSQSLNEQQQLYFNYSQIGLGAIVAIVGFWGWRKKNRKS